LNRPSTRRVLPLALTVLASLTLITFQRSAPATQVNLVAISVIASDKATGLPVKDLTNRDFQIFDNGKPAALSYFRAFSDSDSSAEGLSFWLVVGCDPSAAESRTAAVRKRSEFARHVLERLAPRDTVGVARWCEAKGTAKVDLAPTADRQAPLQAIDASSVSQTEGNQVRHSHSALLKLLQRVTAASYPADLAPLPVLLFLESEEIDSSREQAQGFAQEVLSHSSLVICPAVNDSRATRLSGNSVTLLSYLAEKTGGQVFSAGRFGGNTGIDSVLAAFHSRYQLAYAPGALDSGWHEIEIRSAKDAVPKGTLATLSYRAGYLSAPGAQYNISERKALATKQSLSSLPAPPAASAGEGAFLLSVRGAMYEGNPRSAQFKLNVDQAALSWSAQDEGRQRSEVALKTDFLSSGGESLGQKLAAYEITRRELNAWSILRPIEISVYADVPENTDRIRFVIRDKSSGRTGFSEVSMQEILAAPRLRKVIY